MATEPQGREQRDRAEEEDLRSARALLLPPALAEPRPGFVARVATRAAEAHARPAGAPWWRWLLGGGALAGAAAAALSVALPHPADPPVTDALADAARQHELVLVARLDLYEDLAVVQDQDALDELELVSRLHELDEPAGGPLPAGGRP